NAQNVAGRTALLNAAEAKNTDVVKLLLGAGANPNVQDNKGETAMTLSSNSDEIKLLLVSYGVPEK
ncbi:MAG: ankyrin repeat domain-containing protein, partial [Pyrinomonadaceae bacterium]